MMTPATQPTPDSKAPETTWGDLPPIDDGTMEPSLQPAPTPIDAGSAPPGYVGLWVASVIVGASLGLAIAFTMRPAIYGSPAPTALSVLSAQQVALERCEPEQIDHALHLGAAFRDHGPEGPYQDLIEAGHEAVAACD